MSSFLHKKWIKEKVLNYLNNIDEPVKKPIRAQIFEFLTVRLETDNLKEKTCAKIHDNKFYIRCFFSDECIQKFESEEKSSIISIKGSHIIIFESSFRFIKDASIKSPGYDCFLNIERFKYSTNITHGLGDLQLMDVREDNDVKVALRRRYKKLYPFSNPGWGVLVEILTCSLISDIISRAEDHCFVLMGMGKKLL
ncbi:15217_t:CDS:2 [Cetraspora pellucida]|uniref:15217_t:CDS:1 n=1 Tax=Cetraspora pellucida TaxID=1433469 RepID=A0A9N9BDV2_9GLOM|nr:15217_t:CDS:2 [Cetraspora pellucida]